MRKEIKQNLVNAIRQYIEEDCLFDMEEVSEGIYYSRAIRTLCVADDAFNEFVDSCITDFSQESADQPLCFKDAYESDYGNVLICKEEFGFHAFFHWED